MSFNLATILHESALAHPEAILAQTPDGTWTYAQVEQQADNVAAGLRAQGLTPGDKVAVLLPNVIEFLFCHFGILKAGLVVVPLNPLLTAPEIAYHLSDSGARLVVCGEAGAPVAQRAAQDAGGIPVYAVSTGSEPLPTGVRPFADLLEPDAPSTLHPCSSDDTAVILYTSGTTGRPKGAELTHFQLYMNGTVSGALCGVQADTISLAVLPLFHVFGMSSVLNAAVSHGASIVLLPRFEPAAVLDALERHRCTIFYGVPTMYVALVQDQVEGRDLSSLRTAISGGASIPGEVIRRFEERFKPVVILEGYGLSETASTTTFNVSATERKVLSIGKPIWGVQVRVIDENGAELPAGPDHVGEIVIRGHNVMKGYLGRPEETAAALTDGWFHSGDLGYRDEDGYFFLVDRLKDLIIRGGYNVYPREVEEALYTHPDVIEVAVVGRPDDRLGEEVVAHVVLRPGADTQSDHVISHGRAQLAAYKYPRDVVVHAELPKGPSGKILKRELR